MCAIFGLLGSYDNEKANRALHRMEHRGSQEAHTVEEKGLFMGHFRLAIVDTQSCLIQPLQKKGVTVTFNGEIYNYKALKAELIDYPFESLGDSEVILAAYLQWGEAFVDRLEGMFAIAIYDKGKLLLFRDRLGEKPLYYLQTKKAFVFASEIKALADYAESLTLDEKMVPNFLMFQTSLAPHTPYKEIRSLEPGSKLVLTKDAFQTSFYDDILPEAFQVISKEEALKGIEQLLSNSVEQRMSKEVPSGYLLSGGVDSALICAMAQKASEEPIETFTLGYEEFQRYDERDYAKEVAQHIGSKHTQVIFTFDDFKATLDESLGQLDEPINDPAALPLLHLFGVLQKDHDKKVILSGEGSDELFLGYRPYIELLDMEQLAKLGKKRWLKNYFTANYSPHREWEWFRRIWNDEVLFRGSLESFSEEHCKKLLRKTPQKLNSFKVIEHHYKRYMANTQWDPKLWYRYLDLKTHQGDYFLKKLDRVSMAKSIEARAPFMDHKLVKYVMSLDPDLLLKENVTKNLLKEVASTYLPDSIVHRKKRGFSYPFIEWMDRLDAWKTMRKLNQAFKLFEPKALDLLISGAQTGKFKQHTFGVYYLLLWFERHQS
ncbi:MAG: asparagine synthase (glutamine-hydrolyzing) [Thiovulaceae bacterium]|nr:asparagine synthase (glutamine-hydrolyzing) [Sulfurimonadaceae bacterium]